MGKQQLSAELKERAVLSYESGEYTYEKLAELYKVHHTTVLNWVKKYRQGKSLETQRSPLTGRQPKLSETNSRLILKIVKSAATEHGYDTDLWTTARLQQVLKKDLKLKISRMSIWRTLKRYEHSYRKPEARFYHMNKDKNSEEWQKVTVPKIKKLAKKLNAILYFEDESNISLCPTVGKTWGSKKENLVRVISPNRGSVSAISAISNSGYLLFNVHDEGKRFCSEDIIDFLRMMLSHHARRHLVVVMDQAPCHTSKKVQRFIASQKRLHVFYLPPRSPEFNPDEEVWNYLKNQELKEHKAKTTKELKKLTRKKLKGMSKNKNLLKGVFQNSYGSTFFA